VTRRLPSLLAGSLGWVSPRSSRPRESSGVACRYYEGVKTSAGVIGSGFALRSPSPTLIVAPFCVLPCNSASVRDLSTPPGVGQPVNPCPVHFQGTHWISQLPRQPITCTPCVPNPGRTSVPGPLGTSIPPPYSPTSGTPAMRRFRGYTHTASRPLCTLHAPVSRHDATLACGVVANLSPLPVSHRDRPR